MTVLQQNKQRGWLSPAGELHPLSRHGSSGSRQGAQGQQIPGCHISEQSLEFGKLTGPGTAGDVSSRLS